VLKAEFEWDGDPRRGLGDYRIPKTLLTRLDSSRIPVDEIAPFKGILRWVNLIITAMNVEKDATRIDLLQWM